MKHLVIFQFLLIACSAIGQELRDIEFTVYGQYPIREVEYSPVDQSAISAGEKPAKPIKISTHVLERIGPYQHKGNSQIIFRDASSKTPVARVNIPDHSEKWLLIFVKNPRYNKNSKDQLKYLIYPFDDSSSNLPNNGLIFLNFSGKPLDGLLEDDRVSLANGESTRYRVQESLPINLWARSFDGKKLLPALIKTYKFEANHRYLMIFFPPVLRGSVDLDVRLLTDTVE